MRYVALASDYDSTLATDGRIPQEAIAALRRLRESGRKLILVTGRELPDLLEVCPAVELFDRVVAENGALLYRPADRSETLLAEPFAENFLHALHTRGVPVSVGRTIIATVQPHETTVLECIREYGLELQVIFNREAVMVLPSGVNKASGLQVALKELQFSPHNVVAIGDGENDHAFIEVCECAVAVSNAVPSLCERADFVTSAPAAAGVLQVIEALLRDDFVAAGPRLARHHLSLGYTRSGELLQLPSYGHNILVAGSSGGGKSTFASALLEQLGKSGYQYCIIDPEGDYDHFEAVVSLGGAKQVPAISEMAKLLEDPQTHIAANLLAIGMGDRPAFFRELAALFASVRARSGRPHWLLIDEAHHVLPNTAAPPLEGMPGLALVTVHPDRLSPSLLRQISVVVAIGESPGATLGSFAAVAGLTVPTTALPQELAAGEAVAWLRGGRDLVVQFDYEQPLAERKRHQRKYAEGDLGAEGSFYFRGPGGRLNLRAQNLQMFMQIADGVDDETWLHHLHRGDFSRWVSELIKDEALAQAAQAVEQNRQLSPRESRERLRAEIERRYTAPA